MLDTLTRSAIVLALAAWSSLVSAAPETERRLRFTITVQNPLSEALPDQRVLIYMPAEETGTQRLTQLDVGAKHRVQHDAAGNTILELVFDEVGAYATNVVTVSATLRMQAEPQRQKLQSPATYLREEPFVEVNDPAIQAFARQLTRSTSLETAGAIYEWVRSNLDYAGFIADDLGAKYALQARRGDCTEYAYLAAALARANDIPARVLGGYATPVDAAPRARDYHNWAELYIDGAWRLLDAQKARFLTNADEYVVMRVISTGTTNPALGDNHRFAVVGRVLARMD